MKKIISFFLILCLMLSFSGCKKTEIIVEDTVPVYDIDGELTEQYKSYISSIISQLEKKYDLTLIFDNLVMINEQEKEYRVTFTLQGDNNFVVNAHCVRNYVLKENIIQQIEERDKNLQFGKSFAQRKYWGFLDYQDENLEKILLTDFSIETDTNIDIATYLEDPKIRKVIRVNVIPEYIKSFKCDDVLLKNIKNNTKDFLKTEMRQINNVKMFVIVNECAIVEAESYNDMVTFNVNYMNKTIYN